MLRGEGEDLSSGGVEDAFECGGADGAEHGVEGGGDGFHVGFGEASGGDGRSAEADTGGLEGAARFERDGVFVAGDVGTVEGFLGDFPGELGEL